MPIRIYGVTADGGDWKPEAVSKVEMRRAIPLLLTIVFALLAAVPLAAAVRATADPTFRPGNFPVDLMAVTGLVLAGTAVAWLLHSRRRSRVGLWVIAFGGLFGLLLGVYGVYGTTVLMGDCADIQAIATTVASSLPEGYCDRISGSLMIGYYMIAVGIASVVSFAASAWVSRNGPEPALD